MSVRVGVLASGSGTNLQALIDAELSPAELSCVVCNVPGAKALSRAEAAGLPAELIDHKAYPSRTAFEDAVVARLRAHGVEWVVLAGFMRILGAPLLSAFPDRILNIHPSLLPAFPGLDAQGQAHAAGVCISGCTVHLIDAGCDTGPILAQAAVPRLPGDSRDELQRRILAQEHRLLPAVVRAAAEGRIHLLDGRWRIEAPPAEGCAALINPEAAP